MRSQSSNSTASQGDDEIVERVQGGTGSDSQLMRSDRPHSPPTIPAPNLEERSPPLPQAIPSPKLGGAIATLAY